MNDTTEKTAGTNLTSVPEYSETAIALSDLRQRHGNVVYDVTVPKQMKAAKEARAEIRTLRTGLEKRRVEIKAPALERCRLIDAEAKRITAELVALEEPIDLQIKAEETRAEQIKLAAIEAEQTRVQGHRDYINGLRELPGTLVGKPSVRINVEIQELEAQTVRDCEEFQPEADDAWMSSLARMREMLTAQRRHEEEHEQIRKDREELERMRAENERLAREAEERAEADARREREAQESREREEAARVYTIRKQIEAITFVPPIVNHSCADIDLFINDRLKMDPRHFENTFNFAEFQVEACDAFDEAISHLHDMRREACVRERVAYEAAERQRELDAEAECQAEERRRMDAERAQAAQEAKEARLQALTLNKAAQAVVDWAVTKGYGHESVIEDLNAVLLKDAAPVKARRVKA